jgi:hypothetical protein
MFRVFGLVMPILMSLAGGIAAQTPPPIYNVMTVEIPAASGRPVNFVGINDHTHLAAIDNSLGGLSYRVAPDHSLTPIQCDPSVFPRYAHASLGGPHIAGINNTDHSGNVVGDDEHESGSLYGILQRADGTCEAYLHPGSVATIFTGISNVNDPIPFVTGVFWNTTEDGLKGVHGFVKTNTGVMVLDGPGPDDRNFLTGWNTHRDVIGYSLRAIHDNAFTYTAFVYHPDGTYEDLDAPDGGDLCPQAINDHGIIILTAGRCDVEGREAYWYDSVSKTFYLIPKPTPETIAFVPTSIANDGSLVGHYIERLPTGYEPPFDFTFVTHHFIARPAGPTPNPKPMKHKKTHWKRHRQHLKGWWEHGPQQHRGAWWPAADEEGKVVLTDGHRKVR